MSDSLNLTLKKKLQERRGLLIPGASNALAARVIEDLGFEAAYITGAGVTNTFYGMPDLSFIGLAEIVQHTTAVRQAIELPLIVDVDTGFGSALNAYHTIQAVERAGANGVQIEDQIMPKKCGHFSGKEVVSRAEAVERVRAAVEAKRDPDFQIIARTDSRAVLGLDEALERVRLFAEAGADVVFVEAPETVDEIKKVMASIDMPHVLNLVIGGKTPVISVDEARELRCAMVLYANVALQSAVAGMTEVLGKLKADGRVDETTPGIASFENRQRLVRKSYYDDLDSRYTV